MLTQIPLGSAVIPSYPLLVLVGLWAGMWLAAREAHRFDIEGDHIYNLGLYGLVGGLLGGRIWYVITHWDAYASDLTQALSLTANAIDPLAVVLVAVMIFYLYARRYHLSLLHVLDAIAPGAALALIIGGIGAFLGSQTLGIPTSLPWGVPLFGQVRHPAHLYVVLAVILSLGVIWQMRRQPRWAGYTFFLFGALYAGSRLLLDPVFASPQTIIGGLRLVQVLALIAVVIILIIMMRLDINQSQADQRDVKT